MMAILTSVGPGGPEVFQTDPVQSRDTKHGGNAVEVHSVTLVSLVFLCTTESYSQID